jgi:hypothetical protein
MATSSCLSAFCCENLPDNVNQDLMFAEPVNRFIPLRQLLEREWQSIVTELMFCILAHVRISD